MQDTERIGARITDPFTSWEAAAEVDVTKRETEIGLALFSLKRATTEDIADYLSMTYNRQEIPSSVSPRMKPMERKGLVLATADTQYSRQGRRNRVYVLTTRGQHWCKDLIFKQRHPVSSAEQESD